MIIVIIIIIIRSVAVWDLNTPGPCWLTGSPPPPPLRLELSEQCVYVSPKHGVSSQDIMIFLHFHGVFSQKPVRKHNYSHTYHWPLPGLLYFCSFPVTADCKSTLPHIALQVLPCSSPSPPFPGSGDCTKAEWRAARNDGGQIMLSRVMFWTLRFWGLWMSAFMCFQSGINMQRRWVGTRRIEKVLGFLFCCPNRFPETTFVAV